MGNEKPICSYDLKMNGLDDRYSTHTIEWDLVSSENRIKDLVDNKAYTDLSVYNFELYNSKEIESDIGVMPSGHWDDLQNDTPRTLK